MNKLIILFLALVSLPAFGQRDLFIDAKDFNEDGIMDTLKSYYEGGSGFGGKYVSVKNGKTGEFHEMTSDGCFCEIRHTLLIPPALNKPENLPFLEAIKKNLLPERKNSPDSSLDWMINGAFYHKEPDSNRFFNLIIDPKTKWIEAEFEYPQNYYIEIKGDSLQKLYGTTYESPDWYDAKNTRGFLIYYAHNHSRNILGDSLTLSDSNAIYQAFRTSHGVLVKKENLHKWVFITDYWLTGAPEKLRWASIKKIALADKYLIIQQTLSPDIASQIFFLNTETGICAKLKFLSYDSENPENGKAEAFSVNDDKFTMTAEGKKVEYELKDIFKELDEQTIPRE